jgi:hypothetical protein
VGAGRAQQVQSVGLGLGQGLLVPEYDAGGIVLDPAEGDEAPALACLPAPDFPGKLEGLGIAVDGRLGSCRKTPVWRQFWKDAAARV